MPTSRTAWRTRSSCGRRFGGRGAPPAWARQRGVGPARGLRYEPPRPVLVVIRARGNLARLCHVPLLILQRARGRRVQRARGASALPDSLAERPADLRESLGAENDEHDAEDEQELLDADLAKHGCHPG